MKTKIKYLLLGAMLATIISFSTSAFADQLISLLIVDYKIMVNGSSLQSDLPVLNYNGNTYIPLRKVSEATGANVEWDSINRRVNITSSVYVANTNSEPQVIYKDREIVKEVVKEVPKEVIKEVIKEVPIEVSKEDTTKLTKLKVYSYIADEYRRLDDINGWISTIDSDVSNCFNATPFDTYYSNAISRLNSYIDMKNKELDRLKITINIAASNGIDVSDMNDIFKKYTESIEFYKKSFDSIYNYRTYSYNKNYFDDYLYNRDKGGKEAIEGSKLSFAGYTKYFNLIQDLK